MDGSGWEWEKRLCMCSVAARMVYVGIQSSTVTVEGVQCNEPVGDGCQSVRRYYVVRR